MERSLVAHPPLRAEGNCKQDSYAASTGDVVIPPRKYTEVGRAPGLVFGAIHDSAFENARILQRF